MSNAELIAATREYIPVRVDQTADQWAWRDYGIEGIGQFAVLNARAEKHTVIPMQDVTTGAVVAAFRTTLAQAWKELAQEVKRIEWQPSLAAARTLAAETKRPLAVLLVKSSKPEGDGAPTPDAKGAALLELLGDRALAPQYERYIWTRIDWLEDKPDAAKEFGLTRAPALALVEADGAKVTARVTRFHPLKLAAQLDKTATKAEAAAERERERERKAAK